MRKYLTTITDDVLKSLADIPDSVIEKDIADTQSEISSLIMEMNGLRLIQEAQSETHGAGMKEFVLESTTARRIQFVEFLQKLLMARKQCQIDTLGK